MGKEKKRGPMDFPLFIVILILLCFGLIMVFSASMVEDVKRYNNIYFHLIKQSVWLVIGMGAMITALIVPYQKLRNRKFINFGMAISLILLVAVLFTPSVNGAKRWFALGGANLQPSEIAKVMIIIYLADIISRKGEKIRTFSKGVVPILLVAGVLAALILKEPNMSTAMIIMAVTFCMLIVGGARFSHLFSLVLLGLAGGGFLAMSADYRRDRVLGFLNPWKDALGSGYQVIQSLYALGAGGFFGAGLGQSRQKWYYIPEAQNDFIFAIIGEELGFLGTLFVIILFVILVWRGMKIALNCTDRFGSLLAAGITALIAVQSSINLLVVSSFMPVTGVPLPLISYGGSSFVITMASLGVLLNISRNASRNGVE
jgi:cell division protein FtsW